jgi:hypothetical protein
MHKYVFPVAAAILAAATSAASAVTVTSSFGAPDPGAPGQTLLVDFENDVLPPGYSLTGDFGYATNSTSAAAAPAGDTSRYLFVSSAIPNGSATLSTFDLTAISFYWGSIDMFNSVDVLLSNGSVFSILGGELEPANGDQTAAATNRRVFFTAGPGEFITGLTFKSTGVAFELDDVYGTLANGGTGAGTVPEPQSWALLIAGFSLVGIASRRRRNNVVAA